VNLKKKFAITINIINNYTLYYLITIANLILRRLKRLWSKRIFGRNGSRFHIPLFHTTFYSQHCDWYFGGFDIVIIHDS